MISVSEKNELVSIWIHIENSRCSDICVLCGGFYVFFFLMLMIINYYFCFLLLCYSCSTSVSSLIGGQRHMMFIYGFWFMFKYWEKRISKLGIEDWFQPALICEFEMKWCVWFVLNTEYWGLLSVASILEFAFEYSFVDSH